MGGNDCYYDTEELQEYVICFVVDDVVFHNSVCGIDSDCSLFVYKADKRGQRVLERDNYISKYCGRFYYRRVYISIFNWKCFRADD